MKKPEWFGKYPVMPIINQVSPDESLMIAEALLVGGVRIMEITLRSDEAQESLIAVRKEFPEIVLGAGSVVNPEQLEWIRGEGLDFAVAPGWSDECWQKANILNLPFIPGILTPTELIKAIDEGCLNPKIFPVEPVGGMSYLKSLLAPFRAVGLQCLPTGRILEEQVSEYLNDPQVAMVGGSWLTPPELIKAKDISTITKLAKSSLLFANEKR